MYYISSISLTEDIPVILFSCLTVLHKWGCYSDTLKSDLRKKNINKSFI